MIIISTIQSLTSRLITSRPRSSHCGATIRMGIRIPSRLSRYIPQTIPDKSGANRKPPIRFPIANDHQPRNPINDQLDDGNQPIINPQETSSTNRRTPIQSDYWSPIGSQAKADLVDGYTQLITDRVRAGWSCHLVTILFSQLPGPRTAIISRMKDEVHRIYSTLLTRVHRKPRTASTDELPLLNAMDLPVYKRDKAPGPMVVCNGGLHAHAPMLIPPTSRLKGSLADHFMEKRDLYAGPGRCIVRIDVQPVIDHHQHVVDYVLKTVLNGRLSYDEAVLVLPRSRGELENGFGIPHPTFVKDQGLFFEKHWADIQAVLGGTPGSLSKPTVDTAGRRPRRF